MNEKLNFPAKTLKRMSQESTTFLLSGTRINEALWYHVSIKYPGDVNIHLFEVGESLQERKHAHNLFIEGLRELAHRLNTDPGMAEVTRVVGWSQLVYRYPRSLERLGFQVVERDEKKKEALAVMSRADFLGRYLIPD